MAAKRHKETSALAKGSISGIAWPHGYLVKSGIGLGGVVALVCLLGTLVGCTPGTPSPTLAWPPRHVPTSEKAARRLVERLDQALRIQGPVRVVITEAEATSYLVLNLQEAPIRDLAVCFTPGEIHLWAKVRAWREPTLQMLLTVTSARGRPQVDVRGATLNGRPLPRFLLASLQEATNDALSDAHSSLWVEQVMLGEGLMILVGSTSRSN